MPSHYRDKFEILSSILEIANGNAVRQVEIINKAKIPYSLFKEYLLVMYENGLIEIQSIRHQQSYRTTAKGNQFLSIYNGIKATT